MSGSIDWGYDAGRLGALSFTLTETGGGAATGAVSLTGQYMHSVSLAAVEFEDPITGEADTTDVGYVTLASALKIAMDAVGNASYTVTFDATTRAYTISASGGSVTAFAISSPSTPFLRYVGVPASSGALTYTGSEVWHYTAGSVGGFSEWQMLEDDAEAQPLVGADGSVRGLVPVGVPMLLDFVVPWEPIASVWNASATADDWTWQRAYARCRTVEPLVVADQSVTNGLVVGYMRADSCTLRPRLASADYLTHQSVPVGMYAIGRSNGWSIPWSSFAFSRASEASYLSADENEGSPAFMLWAATDELRYEGGLALLEGARTCQVLRNQDIDNAAWTTFGAATVTAGQNGPDGTTAERIEVAAGTNIRYQVLTPGAGWRAFSGWARATTGTTGLYFGLYDGGQTDAGTTSLTTTWRRITGARNCGAGAGNISAADSRVSAGTGVSAGARDVHVTLMQIEAGRFASSAIRTAGTTATRAADTAVMTSGVNALLYTAKGEFADCVPDFGSANTASADVFWLLSVGGSSDGIRIRHNGTDVRVEAVDSGSVVASSGALSWTAGASIGPVSWDPISGRVYVNGVAGSAGTPWAWPSSAIRVGGIYGGASEAFCALGMLRGW